MDGFRDLDDASFDVALRGYDRQQVDEHLASLQAELKRLRERVAQPGEIPGDGSYSDEVRVELETVSAEVEAIVSAARDAAEGLRRRAATEATRWRDEADSDARRWRSEAEEESVRVRSEAEEASARLTSEAQAEVDKKRSDADTYASRVRGEADVYSQHTREAAEAESTQVREEADVYSQHIREAAEAESIQVREEARTDAATWRGEAEAETRALREEADSHTTDLRESAVADSERMRAESEAAALEVRTAAEAYSATLRDSANQDTSNRLIAATEAAENLRASVWDEATAILDQVSREVAMVREKAENDSLALIAEGERQSHRLVSQARQASEENRRSARIDAERLVGDAQAQHDEIIQTANRAAQAAQERAQALEQRREELMSQLEKAQEAMRTLESELDTKRENLRDRDVPVDLTTVRVVSPPEPKEQNGVKVVKPVTEPQPVSAEEIMDEVRSLREQRQHVAGDETIEEAEPVAEPVATVEAVDVVPVEVGDDIDSLFANLRAEETPAQPDPGLPAGADPDQIRERLLLPIQNRALRHVKRQLTELQNLALEQLRVTKDKWDPEVEVLVGALAGPVTELALESVRAGYRGASELGVPDVTPPQLTADDVESPATELATVLTGEVQSALDAARKAGDSSRKISATVSKIFRGWRNDDAERRLREASGAAYDDGMKAALALAGYADADWALGDRSAASRAS
ncbi:MAG: DivIVA domain-containing protein [Acidimicrobiia bacterium]